MLRCDLTVLFYAQAEVSDHAQDPVLQEKLWKMSEEFISARRQELGI